VAITRKYINPARLIVVLLLSFMTTISAKKLYKYQDAEGLWHYSDKKPAEGQSFESKQLKAEPKRHVWLEKTGEAHRPAFFIRNTYYGPVEVEVKFIDQQNAVADPPLPRRFVVEPGRSATLFRVAGANRKQSWQFQLAYRYTIGSPFAEQQADAVYLPPVAAGSRFLITQAFDGPYSHQDKQNRYAVDIAMPKDTPVHAARAGVVMDVEDDYFNSGAEQAFKSRANSIRILHEDGSMAVYAHLALEKAQVYPGMAVEAGQLIGYSGNTGFTTGPHLHFAIQVNKGMDLSSVPFAFIDEHGGRLPPQAGMWLRGLGPRISR